MQCFKWSVVLFLITELHSCVSHPLGIRIAPLVKQHESLQDSEFDDYELDDEVDSESRADDSHDRADHLLNDNMRNNDDFYEDYDDANDLGDNVNDENDDEVFNDSDDDHHNEVIKGNDVEDHSSNEDIDRIPGYRPDVALTSPLEYYN
ncbi:origin recognition complex subunit 5 [Bactrocera oleae]|uniref:origin recognition complex subunit 5 n=1 Tax=Bactrocera oleae TaxID=104688 RepID=UPI00174C9D7F|nr:coiled-coil domain-containing protein 1-like [Bactrocera oleae]